MYTKAILLTIFFSCCLLVKYLWPSVLRKLYLRYVGWRYSTVEENWKKARTRREEWEAQNSYAPAWHRERQELLRIELGAFMLFVDKGPNFSDEILQYRARDLEELAAEIVDEGGIFQNRTEEE